MLIKTDKEEMMLLDGGESVRSSASNSICFISISGQPDLSSTVQSGPE